MVYYPAEHSAAHSDTHTHKHAALRAPNVQRRIHGVLTCVNTRTRLAAFVARARPFYQISGPGSRDISMSVEYAN